MDKLAAIRIYDGQNYSDEIPVTALAENIQWDESSTLIDILGSINLTRKGNIQDQIDELNNRINQETYSKPIDGIPKTDLANSVQISLGKADTALQSYTETDPTVPAWAKQPNKPTYTAQEVGALPADSQITVEVDDTLSIQGAAADAKKVGNELVQIKQDLEIQQVRAETVQALKINKPVTNPNGTQGQILQTDGQGGTSWVNKQTDEQIADAVTDWLDDHVTPGGSTIVVDDTLGIQGAAADAKKVGDEIATVKDGLSSVENNILTDNIRQALLQIAEKVAYIDEDGQDYYDDLYDALYPPAPPAELVSISAVYTQSGTVYATDTLDSLKTDLVVTATYSDQTTETVTTYTLSGTLTVGTSTITVSYNGKTTTFSVAVTEPEWGSDYTWLYNPADNQLLSERTDIVTASIGTGCSETLVDGVLKLFVPQKTNNFIKFELAQQTNTKGKLTAKVKFHSVGYVATAGTGFRLQISNGTNGSQIFERWDGSSTYNFGVYEGTTYSNKIEFDIDRWYIISVERTNTGQVVSVDGTAILESSTMSTNYCTKNAIFVQNSVATNIFDDSDVDIAWITYKNND